MCAQCQRGSKKGHSCRVSPSGHEGFCFRRAKGSQRFWLVEPAKAQRPLPKEPVPESDRKLDKIHRAYLARLPLSQEDEANLRRRGFDKLPDYGTLPEATPAGQVIRIAAQRAAAEVAKGLGTDLRRVFMVNDLSQSAGMLIPLWSAKGLLVGLQIRSPDARVKEGYPRYLFGKRAKARVHVAGHQFASAGEAWLVEGGLKAELTSQKLGATVLGLPGVGQALDEAVRSVQDLGLHTVVIAYDQDPPHKTATLANVVRARQTTSQRLRDVGVTVKYAVWDSALAKGPDDLLVAGHKPTLTNAVAEPPPRFARTSPAPEAQQPRLRFGRKAKKPDGDPKPRGGKKRGPIYNAQQRAFSEAAAKASTDKKTKKSLDRVSWCLIAANASACGNKGCGQYDVNLAITRIRCESVSCEGCQTWNLNQQGRYMQAMWPCQIAVATHKLKDDSLATAKAARDLFRKQLRSEASELVILLTPGEMMVMGPGRTTSLLKCTLQTKNAKMLVTAEAVKAYREFRLKLVKRLADKVRACDIGLATDPWAGHYRHVSSGKNAKSEGLVWPTTTAIRTLKKETATGEEHDPTKCSRCEQRLIYKLYINDQYVAKRDRPWTSIAEIQRLWGWQYSDAPAQYKDEVKDATGKAA